MSKARPTIGIDGRPLPILPPERDARVWAKLVRVLFYTPGFLAMLLLKAGEPEAFGISIELLMLASAASIVGGLFIGTQGTGAGADRVSKIGTWSGALVLELLAVVPLLCAIPSLFHQLAQSKLLHAISPATVDVSLGLSEVLPMVAILPFMLYQLGGFGTLDYILSKTMNWVINIGIFGLIVGSYVANRLGSFDNERRCVSALVVCMAITVFYGVLKLRQQQTIYDAQCPQEKEKDKEKDSK